MTTRYSLFSLFFLSLILSLILSPLNYVKAEEINDISEQNQEEISLLSEDISEFQAKTVEPWFKIEKLTGQVNQGDFVVGPGRAEIEIRPGQTVIHEISVANRISDNRTFEITVEDIAGTSDADRAVVLLGNEQGPYTVKDYISFPENKFTLNLGDRARIPITISLPPDAEPGGYYGSVLISTVQVDDENIDINVPRSPIVARVGTLFFITVPGDVVREGEVKEISLANKKWWYESGPIKFNVLYENKGSVHLNPYGELRIKNILGEEVGFVELEPWFALPKSLRSRAVVWDREMLLGRYVATAFINRGYDDIVDEVSTTFWVLPWRVVGGTFLLIFIIIFGIRAFFRTFEFKRKR